MTRSGAAHLGLFLPLRVSLGTSPPGFPVLGGGQQPPTPKAEVVPEQARHKASSGWQRQLHMGAHWAVHGCHAASLMLLLLPLISINKSREQRSESSTSSKTPKHGHG